MNKLKKTLLVLSMGMGLGMGISYSAWAVTPQACQRYADECQEGNLDSCAKYRRYNCDRYHQPPYPGND